MNKIENCDSVTVSQTNLHHMNLNLALSTALTINICSGQPNGFFEVQGTTAVPAYYDYDEGTTDVSETTVAEVFDKVVLLGFRTEKVEFFTLEPPKPEANGDVEQEVEGMSSEEILSENCKVLCSIRGWLYARLDNRFMVEDEIE